MTPVNVYNVMLDEAAKIINASSLNPEERNAWGGLRLMLALRRSQDAVLTGELPMEVTLLAIKICYCNLNWIAQHFHSYMPEEPLHAWEDRVGRAAVMDCLKRMAQSEPVSQGIGMFGAKHSRAEGMN